MKKIYSLFLGLFFSSLLFGQMTFPYEQNFDTFMAGEKFVKQVTSTTEWTTWSNAPGGAEDPVVSDVYSISEPNSIKIGANNDLVLLTGDQTEGRYLFSFNMYVPDGKLAYYNMLQSFAGSSSKWAYQILFVGGNATIEAATEGAFTYDADKWFELKTIIDLDVDWCEIYKDGELVHEFQWSVGTSATNLKQMSAVNFYGWDNDGSGTPEYYFDNLLVKTIDSPEAPADLTATLENGNDILLAWSAPATVVPDSYSVYKNGVKVADGLTSTSFQDENVYPQTFVYAIRAFYAESGLSSPVTTEIEVSGGIARKTVLFEVGTGTWCTYCPGAARGVDQLVAEGKQVSIIEYHSGDEYETTESANRLSFYGIEGYPTAYVDGTTSIVGGSLTGNMYNNYLGVYEKALAVPAVVDMDMSITMENETDGTIMVTAKETFHYFESGLKLRFAITESHIEDTWFNLDEVNFVCRDMIVGDEGLNVVFGEDSTQTFEVGFSLNEWNENLKLVAFIQHDDSKMVAQAVTADVPAVVKITFNADLSTTINAGGFTAGTDNLYLTGSFNGWDEPGTGESVLMTDSDNDKIYTGIVYVAANYGELKYKYFKNVGWDNGEWNGEPNRIITVADVDMVVNDDVEMAWTSIDENNALQAVSCFPNPFINSIKVNNSQLVKTVKVANSLGQVIMEQENSMGIGEINTQNYPAGVYFIQLFDAENNSIIQKVIKQ